MPYINVNDAYILDNTGKQVDDAVDYALANSNRNLLDNPFFTIRQMGTGGVTGVGYAVDRWKNTGGANLTQTPRSPYGITFASSSGYQVDQALWDYPAEYLDGKRLTISVMTSGGNTAQATGVFTATSSTAGKVAVTSADGNFTVGLYYIPSARAVPFVRITTPSGRFPVNAAILAVKLEIGSYSTLANDVPPDYESEKRKCMAYFQRISLSNSYTSVIGFGVMQNAATNVRINIPTSVPFREGATLSASAGNIGQILIVGNGQSLTATAVTARSAVKTGGVLVDVTVNGNATANQMYAMQFYTYSAYIDINGDL